MDADRCPSVQVVAQPGFLIQGASCIPIYTWGSQRLPLPSGDRHRWNGAPHNWMVHLQKTPIWLSYSGQVRHIPVRTDVSHHRPNKIMKDHSIEHAGNNMKQQKIQEPFLLPSSKLA